MANRYALIDNFSGFVWGVVDAGSAIEAARICDEGNRDGGREYDTVSKHQASSVSGYRAYEVPAGFDVVDGQSDDEIEAVQAHPYVEFVTFKEMA